MVASDRHVMPHRPAGARAEVHVSVPPLVEVMQGELITLDCTPREHPEHYVLEWFLVSALWLGAGDGVGRRERRVQWPGHGNTH